ncbi:copine family protein 1-like isoform X2 [Ruditapes philippinarum]|uniref:copine family protein 1-like isoform X2 n=1 Tax=Ruditapes philippinarum TaxID=129788 RepID=UPI00295B6D97|nr:copine family protein 1-like isoform X2 [Ruditapes philippinarum]XP_060578420.1 copine family protein 1-like isoform X2 [Ruditapes philippinarum]
MGDNTLRINRDRFSNLRELGDALAEEGLKKCGLIFGIDYTMSNKVQGEKTFDGKNLHEISEDCLNPYQEVISILGETLQPLDSDGLIPAYGFGDFVTKGDDIFPLKDYGSCVGFREVLQTYNRITPDIKLFRPTNFAPLIRKAINIVKQSKKYHILVIAADGQVNAEEDTIQAIVDASNYPLSIICVGVGDGPWGMMKEFDTRLPKRTFDNFQFLDFHDVVSHARNRQTAFALHALMEIPDQYHAIQELGLLERLQEDEEA